MKKCVLLFSILIFVIQLNAQVNLSSGLVAYFPFNGNTLDASGNGNHAANYGAILTADQWGNANSAYSFNGLSDYMQITNNAGLQPTSLTLCARVKPNGFYNGVCYNSCIIDKGYTDYIPGDYGLRFTNALSGNCNIPGFANQNYRSDIGDMTTSNFTIPFGGTPFVATNQWDCLVSTYNGTTVNIYVNGVLRYSYNQPTIGSNTDDVFLGRKNSVAYPYWFNGVMDEVRIYDRALNIQEIDSVCNLVQTSPTIINQYAAVYNYVPCSNSLLVDTATNFSVGDTVLIIQMKGTAIDSSNTSLFGEVINYNNCGNYEINVIQNISGNSISLLNTLTRSYDISNGKVQLVSVPTFTNYNLNTPHSCMAWNGNKGGVFIINVLGNLSMNNTIDVSGKGFRGGVSNIINSNVYACNNFQFFDTPNIDNSAAKGEGVSQISISKSYARGKLANGGGGGNAHNAGGGGGSNGNIGGLGGSQHNGCNPNAVPNNTGGIGGLALNYTNAANKIFLGGGGGAGHSNNYYTNFPVGNLHTSDGAPGGGIVIIKTANIISNGSSIISNGDDGYVCINTGATSICHDAMGGGGAGGTILLSSNSVIGNVNIICKGGNGGNVSSAPYGQLGPGGGGSGGVFWYNGVSIPATLNVNTSFGVNGVFTNYSNDPWGATSGLSGISLTQLILPMDTTLYNSPANFANAGIDTTVCQGMGTQLHASGGVSYSWLPTATLSNATIFNPIATPNSTTTYTVITTDANGCTDIDDVTITVSPLPLVSATATPPSICLGGSTVLLGNGASTYTWTNGVINGIPFSPNTTTTYNVTGVDANGCSNTNSVTVNVVNNLSVFIVPANSILCLGDSVQLFASGATNYTWLPNSDISNVNISDPFVFPSSTSSYTVTGSDATGCTGTSSVTIDIVVDPKLTISKSGDVECNIHTIQLSASGATNYAWSPASFLSSPNAAITNATILAPTTFVVIGTIGSCTIIDSIHVDVYNDDETSIFIPNAFTPNGDEKNDCLRVINYAKFSAYYFAIYNRWGQRVFESNNPSDCWNGDFKNEKAPVGVYYYFLKAETRCGKILKKGDITLLR